MALAPLGFEEIMWCELKNKNDVEEIVKVWRSRDLRRHARLLGLPKKKGKSIVALNRRLVEVSDGKRRVSVLEAKPNISRLRAAIPKGKS